MLWFCGRIIRSDRRRELQCLSQLGQRATKPILHIAKIFEVHNELHLNGEANLDFSSAISMFYLRPLRTEIERMEGKVKELEGQ